MASHTHTNNSVGYNGHVRSICRAITCVSVPCTFLQILAVASQGMAQLTSTRGSAGGAAPSAPSTKEVANLGEGVVEGSKAIAKGFLAGAVGILAKPMEGAERGGMSGFIEGIGKVSSSSHPRTRIRINGT